MQTTPGSSELTVHTTKIWAHLDQLICFRQVRNLYEIYSAETFRSILERERARNDRYGHTFSLVVFGVERREGDEKQVKQLALMLARRKRSADEIGWMNDGRIGVVLTGTSERGARQFVQDIYTKMGPFHPLPQCRIYQYPPGESIPDTHPGAADPDEFAPPRSNDSELQEEHVKHKDSKISWGQIEEFLTHTSPVWKRSVDVVLSTILLICLSPVLLMIAAFIKVVSPGPVLFTQKRIGYQGKPFTMWKFRTMRIDAEVSMHRERVSTVINSENPMTKLDMDDDPRIIRAGNLLRQTGLDELPQLFNVLRGEMSLVGPRPDPVYAVDEYPQWYHARLNVLPGITGLWQVNGKNRTTFKEMVRMDIEYGRNRSFWLDLKIIAKTMPAILKQVRESVSKATAPNTQAAKGAKEARQAD